MNKLYFRVRDLYRKQGGVCPEPVINLTWNYGEQGPDGEIQCIDVQRVAKEINGYYLADVFDDVTDPPTLIGRRGEPCAGFANLRADGTTACGNWLYSGSYVQSGGKEINLAARRERGDPAGLGLFSGWGWSWPTNRRILYNRHPLTCKEDHGIPEEPLSNGMPAGEHGRAIFPTAPVRP